MAMLTNTSQVFLPHQLSVQGRINHCAGCTMGGGSRRRGVPDQQLLNFDHAVLTYVQEPQVSWLKCNDY